MVATDRILAGRSRFVLTDHGTDALQDDDVCHCVPRLAGLILLCPLCETVYGVLSDHASGPYAVPKSR